jgi:hypothetical protein
MNTDEFKTEEEFDLYVKGAWDERNRILALLEHEETRSAEDFFGAHQSEQCVTCRNIARIEGESK